MLLALLIVEIAWLRGWLRNSPRIAGATEPELAKQANYASANSISITFSHPLEERGIQLVILAEDPTTPEVIEGVECHQLLKRPRPTPISRSIPHSS